MTAPPLEATTASTARIDGRELIVFGGCNYLGLAQHSRVLDAARDALGRFGLSASASRETTGNAAVHSELEAAMAAYCGFGSGLLVPDGYIANLAAVQGLTALGVRHAAIDERAHASLFDAARMGGLEIGTYGHLDAGHAGRLIGGFDGPAAVLTDSVFAADGVVAPLPGLVGALRGEDRIVVDDCHGFCVLGDRGRGAVDAAGLDDGRIVMTTTLAKGLGCGGGMVLSGAETIRSARTHSTAYVCTTPVSPALAGGALEALRLMASEAGLFERLRMNASRVAAVLGEAGLGEHDADVPVFAFTAGDADAMQALHRAAWDAGVWMPLVAYPGGPAPVYFRLAVTASHTAGQIERLGDVLRAALGALKGVVR